MYADQFSQKRADQPAIIMADTGASITYRQFDQQTNKVAHLLRSLALNRLDHYAVFMENSIHYPEICGAGERSGLYYTCINSYLTADELAYILNNSESQAVFTSTAKCHILKEALKQCPKIKKCYVVANEDEELPGDMFVNYHDAINDQPSTPIADEFLGTAMLYSSGTTGRPKGILRPLEPQSPSE